MTLLLHMLGNVWTGVLLAAFFGISIFIHELGHFLVARWCGLVVDTFAVGFGPAIWKRTYGGVVYKIGIFPIGGYVALPQLDRVGHEPHPRLGRWHPERAGPGSAAGHRAVEKDPRVGGGRRRQRDPRLYHGVGGLPHRHARGPGRTQQHGRVCQRPRAPPTRPG